MGLSVDKFLPRLYDHTVKVRRLRCANFNTGEQPCHHIGESLFQRSLKAAAPKAALTQGVTSHTLRHSFARHLLAEGYDIRTVQEFLGHKDVRMTMIYTHVLNRGGAVCAARPTP